MGTDSLLMLTPTVAHKLSPYQTIYAYKMYDQNISISNLYNILLRDRAFVSVYYYSQTS